MKPDVVISHEKFFNPMAMTLNVIDMHEHFKFTEHQMQANQKFVLACLREEYCEMLEATTPWDILDAQIDMMYFAAGAIAAKSDYDLRRILREWTSIDEELIGDEPAFAGLRRACSDVDPISYVAARLLPGDISQCSFILRTLDLFENQNNICWLMVLVYLLYADIYRVGNGDIFESAFLEVHHANLRKQVGSNTKRQDFPSDLVKPYGWQPPDLKQFFQAKQQHTDSHTQDVLQHTDSHTQDVLQPADSHTQDVLQQRGSKYGPYSANSSTTQGIMELLMAAPNWKNQPQFNREALHMIAHKMARVVCGDPYHADNFVDIAGYAELARKEILSCHSPSNEKE